MDDEQPRNVTAAFERQVSQLPADVQVNEAGLIELGRESARRFDDGVDAAGSRVQRVLTELRRVADRWERLTLPAAQPVEAERSQLDELRARRQQRESGGMRPG